MIGEVAKAEAARRACADTLQNAENALAEADRDARAALEAASAAREELARAEERFEGSKRRLADIGREIHDMLEIEPAAVAALAEIKAGEALPDLADGRGKARTAAPRTRAAGRGQPARRGGTARGRDPAPARSPPSATTWCRRSSKLRQGIQSLNREARERLLASFEQVNKHFQHLFTKLFGGGTAELQLVESDDPLEAGLEIMAKPPGKKPSTLSLLSGGEQALTALALIFAVFLTNPAPICVLDEVDAPLDDHNVERFCDLLDEMTKSTDTRFVIITHNPITMARMNRLYGVTMAERGVSQLVSVDLQAAVQFREAG